MTPPRFVLTGGPGTGKTTLLAALADAGFAVRAEVSRELIREQHAAGGALLPWRDLRGFARLCLERMRGQLAEPAPTGTRAVFFDRGGPDVAAYLRQGGWDEEAASALAGWRGVYASPVFVAPPWREIFVNDPERPQSFAECAALHERLLRAYAEAGYRTVLLPRASVAERVVFVTAHAAPACSGAGASPVVSPVS